MLAALPPGERDRLARFSETVELDFSEMLIEPDEPIRYIYFPIDAVTSTLQGMSDGSSVEVGLAGIEGCVGLQLWLRVSSTSSRTIVQVAGRAHRMTAEDFEREVMNTTSPLNTLIARYTHAFLALTSQVAACNRLHTIDERLARWLKMVHDRVRRDEFDLRHEFIAQMLGVHRPTVTTAARILQRAGVIEYARGRIKVLDAEGLTESACECYELITRQFDRITDRPWRAS